MTVRLMRLLIISLSLLSAGCQERSSLVAQISSVELSPEPGSMQLKRATLPYFWEVPEPGAPASARAIRAKLEFERSPGGPELAVMSLRTTIVFTARLNGVPIHTTGDESSQRVVTTSWKATPIFHLAADAMKPGSNILELTGYVPRDAQQAALGTVMIGPAQAIEQLALQVWVAHYGGPMLIAAVLIAVGFVAIGLWRGRSDSRLFLLLAAGTILWGLQGLIQQWPQPLLPLRDNAVLIISLYVWFPLLVSVFFLRFADVRSMLFERAAAALSLLAAPMLYLGWITDHFGIANVLLRASVLVFITIALAGVVRYAWRIREWTGTLLLVFGSICVLFAVRDFAVSLGDDSWNMVVITPYSGVTLVLFAGWMLLERYHRAFASFEELNRDLEGRVAHANVELHRRLEQVGAARLAAERANVSKSRFFAAASHDLRQPLHSLGLFAEALKDRVVDPESRKLAQRIGDSIDALDRLFEELLDLSRLDAGTVEVRRRPVALQAVFDRLDSEFRAAAATKGLRLRLVPTALVVDTDPVLLERVLVNLVANAVRYTNAGGVLVAARRRGAVTRLEVSDTGIGIPPDQRALVFDEFYQVGNPGRDRRQGLGLGLAIVRRLTTLLGHRLALDSVIGRGTRFTLELPLADRPVDTTPVADAVRSELFEGRRILLVDDEPDILAATATLLDQWGCTVRTALGLSGAIELINAGFSPEALLADLRLGGEHDGVDVVARVRGALGRELPALLISGDAGARDLARVKDSGLLLLTKPVAPARLRSALHALLSEPRGSGGA